MEKSGPSGIAGESAIWKKTALVVSCKSIGNMILDGRIL
jgi:hypothetical protein